MTSAVKRFQKTILGWFVKNGRHDLPWRHTTNPYRVLVSEVMLQQTQVDRVSGYYKAFLRAFPTVKKLAEASPAEVLAVWKGLGYNRRALYLKRAAEMIVVQYRGRFPRDVADIESLPGVGHYTARAVSVFAFNTPEVFIETNIRRVFIHTFFPERKEVSDQELIPIIHRALYKKNPRMWYGALMDYGALALSDIENPNRRSSHYTRQSRFEGSRRYARAKILDFLLKKKSCSLKDFRQYFEKDTQLHAYVNMVEDLLRKLMSEGFLRQEKGRWALKS